MKFQLHQQLKVAGQEKKLADKARAQKESEFESVTFDLESVLQIPSSEVSPFYYKRKVCVYNLTVFQGKVVIKLESVTFGQKLREKEEAMKLGLFTSIY